MSELITNQYADPTPTTAPNRKLAQLNALIDQIAQLFPGHSGEIGVSVSTGCGYRSLTLHGVQAYSTATELMRSLGIQTRRKQIIQSETPWVNVNASVDGLVVNLYCRELPPSCRLEKFVERVPVEKIVRSETDFVEIERTKVVCGNGGDE